MVGRLKLLVVAVVFAMSPSIAWAQSPSPFIGVWEINWLDPQSNCLAKGGSPAPVKETADCSGRLVVKYDQRAAGLAGLKAGGQSPEVDAFWEVKGVDGILHGILSADGRTLHGKYYLLPGPMRSGDFEFKLATGNDKRFDGWYTKPFDPVSKDNRIEWWGVKK